MCRREEISTEELMRRVVTRPVWSYFHLSIGLMDAVKDTGEDALDAMKGILSGITILLICAATMCKHIVILIFYPVSKIFFQWRAAKRILKHHPDYRIKEGKT